MIKVKGTFENSFIVELPVNSFEDIMFDNMSRATSDELIRNAIYEKYGVCADEIIKVNPV